MMPPSTTHVGINEFKHGTDNDILVTYGLATCIGISAYFPSERRGLLGHILGHDDGSTERTIDEFIRQIDTTDERPLIHLAQGFPSPHPEVIHRVDKTRTYVSDAVRETFGAYTDDFCTALGETIGKMALDCETGVVTTQRRRLPEEVIRSIQPNR